MLEIFRTHLKPVEGKVYDVQHCTPFRFRCRQSTSRCVLQYTLRISDPDAGRSWDQWVTGILYADTGEAELQWRQQQASDQLRKIPQDSLTFEPVSFVPELRMLVEVFPHDRRLPNLSRVMGGAARSIEPLLLNRLEAGRWQVEDRTLEPTRYRTELGAALRYRLRMRDTLSGRRQTVRCYLKLYRDERGAETWRVLRSFSQAWDRDAPYSVIKPIAYLSELRTLALEEAPGRSLTRILLEEQDPSDSMRSVARAISSFNQDRLPITRRESRSDQWEDVQLASNLVRWASPESREAVAEIATAVERELAEVKPAPIHGDLKPDHVFLADDRVTFIDLDSAAQADPVRDPAHLAAYLAGRVGLESVPLEIEQDASTSFVEEYFRHVPSSWRPRFPIHYAGALLEVASGIFRRQEPGWRERIPQVINRARDALASEGR